MNVKFEKKYGEVRADGICPVCGASCIITGAGNIDVSGRHMCGVWVACPECRHAFPRATIRRDAKFVPKKS
jgi:hypothetical protein